MNENRHVAFDSVRQELTGQIDKVGLMPSSGFGRISLVIQAGKVVFIERHETFK